MNDPVRQNRPRPAVSPAAIPFPTKKVTRAVAQSELAMLEAAYPAAVTALEYDSPFTLLIAVILSAQCTDARVNLTTPTLFAAYPTPAALGNAGQEDVERIIKSCGFFRMKAKNIIAAAKALADLHGGAVPQEREALEALPGVGRKTANVVLSVAFAEAAFAVDTHVFRVAHRLGLTLGKTPRAVEDDVVKLVPPEKLRHAHHWLILHGRAICKAPIPLCERCPVKAVCPSFPIVERTLVKKARAKTRASLVNLKMMQSMKKSAIAKRANVKSTVVSATVKSATVKSATATNGTAKSATKKSATKKSPTGKSSTVKNATSKKPANDSVSTKSPAQQIQGKASPGKD